MPGWAADLAAHHGDDGHLILAADTVDVTAKQL